MSAGPSRTLPSSREGAESLVTAKVLTTPRRPRGGGGRRGGRGDSVRRGSSRARSTSSSTERPSPPTPSSSAPARRPALLVTEGFRDSVEMALENRFEQYDISIDRPSPLVPRHLRWPVTERMNYVGRGLGPSRRGLGAGAPPSLRATRRRGGRGRAAPLVREPRPRAAGGRDPRRRPAGSPHHPVERGVPRDPGVRAPVHGLRQRLRPGRGCRATSPASSPSSAPSASDVRSSS